MSINPFEKGTKICKSLSLKNSAERKNKYTNEKKKHLFLVLLLFSASTTNRRPCLQTMKSQWMNDICFSFIIISPCLNKFIISLFGFSCNTHSDSLFLVGGQCCSTPLFLVLFLSQSLSVDVCMCVKRVFLLVTLVDTKQSNGFHATCMICLCVQHSFEYIKFLTFRVRMQQYVFGFSHFHSW